ncbi:hypothetical protein BV20DRAFT_1055981 [Pilatotrama ljubarskyi]|nr:hypothetical protein BV20DRAFT_1055981 [Pilatotrama ljubarskyi]
MESQIVRSDILRHLRATAEFAHSSGGAPILSERLDVVAELSQEYEHQVTWIHQEWDRAKLIISPETRPLMEEGYAKLHVALRNLRGRQGALTQAFQDLQRCLRVLGMPVEQFEVFLQPLKLPADCDAAAVEAICNRVHTLREERRVISEHISQILAEVSTLWNLPGATQEERRLKIAEIRPLHAALAQNAEAQDAVVPYLSHFMEEVRGSFEILQTSDGISVVVEDLLRVSETYLDVRTCVEELIEDLEAARAPLASMVAELQQLVALMSQVSEVLTSCNQ